MANENRIKGNNNYVAEGDINILGYDKSGAKFIFSPAIMAEIIDAVYNGTLESSDLDDFVRPKIEEKNALNEISQEFFDNVIKEFYEEFGKIEKFLTNPGNISYQKKYKSIVKEINGEVFNCISRGAKLQDLLPSLLNYAKIKDTHFDSEKGYWLQVFAYYMYVNCDIGKKNDKT